MAFTKKQAGRAATLVIAAAGALLMAPKCGSDIVVPREDRTPPQASLSFSQGEKSGKVSERGTTRKLEAGEQLSVMMTGGDTDGGVRRVTLTVAMVTVCTEGTLRETRTEEKVQSEVDEVGPGEVGTTQILVSTVLGGKIECAGRGTPRTRQYTVFGSVENHAGAIITTPTLIVVGG